MNAAAPSDEELVQPALRGDEDAFAELVRRHKRRILALASRFTRNDYDLDEIAQETFIRVYRKLGSFRGESPFEHWLTRIAVRCCYDFLRHQRRQPTIVPDEDPRDVAGSVVSGEEARELVWLALSQLPPEERLVLTMLEIDDRPLREVANLTGWSVPKVKVRAFRARQSLKRIITRIR